MNAKTVYDVAKALPQVEQFALYNMLQQEFGISINKMKKNKQHVLEKGAAYKYLLKNVFNNNP